MSIHLDIEDYCKNCPNFSVTQDTSNLSDDGGTILISEHTLSCANRNICDDIYKYRKKIDTDNKKSQLGDIDPESIMPDADFHFCSCYLATCKRINNRIIPEFRIPTDSCYGSENYSYLNQKDWYKSDSPTDERISYSNIDISKEDKIDKRCKKCPIFFLSHTIVEPAASPKSEFLNKTFSFPKEQEEK